jgi:hypothetical protein
MFQLSPLKLEPSVATQQTLLRNQTKAWKVRRPQFRLRFLSCLPSREAVTRVAAQVLSERRLTETSNLSSIAVLRFLKLSIVLKSNACLPPLFAALRHLQRLQMPSPDRRSFTATSRVLDHLNEIILT